jgi:hypothetical protein
VEAYAPAAVDPDRLIPLAASAAPAASASPAGRIFAQARPARLSTDQLPLDHGRVLANAADVRSSLGDVMRSGLDARPIFSAASAWSILLLGLIGLFALTRRPSVESARSWVLAIPTQAAAGVAPQTARLDPVDLGRRLPAQDQRRQHGHFARAPRRPFGPSH